MPRSIRSFNCFPPPPHIPSPPGNPVHLIIVRAWVGWGISKRSFRSFQRNTRVFYLQNIMLTTLLIQAICSMRIIYELWNGLAHHRVSTAQLVEHRSAEPEGLRFASSGGLRIIFLSHARDKTKNHISLFLYRAQNLPSFLFYLQKISYSVI